MEKIIEAPCPPQGADDDEGTELRELTVDAAGHGQRLDRWLAAQLEAFSRTYLQQLIDDGAVQVAGRVVRKSAQRLRVGEPVRVLLRPSEQAMAYVPQAMALPIVFEDEHIAVLDKPVGMVVHPGAGHWSGTLLNGLLAHHAGAAALPRAGIVHRLDKDTSGLMVVAKSAPAYEALVAAIAARRVRRIYVALAHGRWQGGAHQTIEQPIGRDPRQRLRMAVHPGGGAGAKPARTDLRVLDGNTAATLLACRLHTGRTHQIRVHLAWLGHPLVGDLLYGGRLAWGMARQALHAVRLGLPHPVLGRWMVWDSALPADVQQAIEAAGLHYNRALLWPGDDPDQAVE
ncbi:RluA family pseudouridine synthase [Tepidimonas aquatica]|uniref:Pseudouridine synthase n=1 Tax=Tepidimonas aquatica TaxID=247482 RepID=A0A554WMZ4_9BURK|nr:RluA family pseudouridine synthase [Tepidimonas aquatica]TSE24945.1 Ribosomal large subunit pseudouridine synthase D [Tepidimonas aquatica]